MLPSASLIPVNDPTLLWINAGVTPLRNILMVPLFLKIENGELSKCIRTNDIENVGKTARHHTFLKCLVIFDGDYFKKKL